MSGAFLGEFSWLIWSSFFRGGIPPRTFCCSSGEETGDWEPFSGFEGDVLMIDLY
jgi:hypothetical protein